MYEYLAMQHFTVHFFCNGEDIMTNEEERVGRHNINNLRFADNVSL